MKETIEKAKQQVENTAFPFVSAETFSAGMTLRDYFAAKAMQAWLTDPKMSWDDEHLVRSAEKAYAAADALLKVR